MKRQTAIETAWRLHLRLSGLSGIIATPAGQHSAYRIRRAWLFGSTVKGAPFPNDIDILYDGFECGRLQLVNRRNWGGRAQMGERIYLAPIDRHRLKAYGWRVARESRVLALMALAGGLKMVRFHRLEIDGELAHPRTLIYPRFDLLG
jgi:predicted nucleotidyltransferase